MAATVAMNMAMGYFLVARFANRNNLDIEVKVFAG
jgi:hypothetical protein